MGKIKFHALKHSNSGMNGFRLEWGKLPSYKYKRVFNISFSMGRHTYSLGFHIESRLKVVR